MTQYRIHFEPIDVEADTPEEAIEKLTVGDCPIPDIRKIFPIDKDGFAMQ